MPSNRKLPVFHRAKEIARLTRSLEQDSYPRLQMVLLVSITGAAGFLASFVLLHAGLAAMWLRYLCAFGVAYLVFLLLLWLWLRTSAKDYCDAVDLSNLAPSPSHTPLPARGSGPQQIFTGKGGTADGGGASGNFELAAVETPIESIDVAKPMGDALSTAADADEFAIPLIVLVLVAALLLSSVWIIYSAPVLFAELLVDGIFAAGLYRHLHRMQSQHWMLTAISRTLWPFVLTAIVFSASGWWMQQAAPEARTIGEFIHHDAQN